MLSTSQLPAKVITVGSQHATEDRHTGLCRHKKKRTNEGSGAPFLSLTLVQLEQTRLDPVHLRSASHSPEFLFGLDPTLAPLLVPASTPRFLLQNSGYSWKMYIQLRIVSLEYT